MATRYKPADPVEYAICLRRGHHLDEPIWKGRPGRCHWCGLLVRLTRVELNAPKRLAKRRRR